MARTQYTLTLLLLSTNTGVPQYFGHCCDFTRRQLNTHHTPRLTREPASTPPTSPHRPRTTAAAHARADCSCTCTRFGHMLISEPQPLPRCRHRPCSKQQRSPHSCTQATPAANATTLAPKSVSRPHVAVAAPQQTPPQQRPHAQPAIPLVQEPTAVQTCTPVVPGLTPSVAAMPKASRRLLTTADTRHQHTALRQRSRFPPVRTPAAAAVEQLLTPLPSPLSLSALLTPWRAQGLAPWRQWWAGQRQP